MKIIRTFKELSTIPTFNERLQYLALDGSVGADTFGFDRYMNQQFYRSREWKRVRDEVITRDYGCDLGLEGYEIFGKILIHHMNPITADDIKTNSDYLLNPDYLICVSHDTHNAIHYGTDLPSHDYVERRPNDTAPWKG